jgi:hypothetical protein
VKKLNRAEQFGISLADVAIESAHLTYNAPRGVTIIKSCILRLQKRISEIQPKKANPKYKAARYG